MRLVLPVRDLVIASWTVDRETIAGRLPYGLEPTPVGGDYLVSLVALRYDGGRIGRLPVPRFSQLNIRTYVEFENEPAVFFLRAYVTPLGIGGIVFGAPYRPARIRVGATTVAAPGLGVSLRFEVTEHGEPGELGRHELGLFEAAGLRAFRIRRGAAEWRRTNPWGDSSVDALLALGFDVGRPSSIFHARGASFEADVPPRRVQLVPADTSRHGRAVR